MAYSSITKPSLNFNTKLYTGNASTNAITGVGFQPDLVWCKDRSAGNNHILHDAVRGVNYQIYADLGNAQTNASGFLTAFGTDGFTLGSDGAINASGNNYASWNWKAGNSAGSTNNDGTIATTVSVNTTAGFSIVKWTGTGSAGTLGHGLGAVPKTIWVKKTSQADDWFIWHEALGAQGKMNFNNSSAVQNDTGYWNNTLPTNQVFSVTSNGANNASGQTYIAYCFSEKKGYSKFGSYTGNGNADGTFVYTGFKPAFVMIKTNTDSGEWAMFDNKRNIGNETADVLRANSNSAESDSTGNNSIDILSNGFKVRGTGGWVGTNGRGFIYMSFAESPLVANVGNGIPATAR